MGSSKTGRAVPNAFRNAVAAGRLERLLRAVDRVISAEEHLDLDVHDRVAGDDSFLQLLAHTLLDGRDVLVRDHAALDRVDEMEPFATPAGTNPKMDVGELAATARLLLVTMLRLGRSGDRFEVGNVRRCGC